MMISTTPSPPPSRQPNRVHPAVRHGFSLIEAVLSLAILAILMTTIGAATGVLVRLMPSSDDPRQAALSIGSALELFESDVLSAVSVLDAREHELELLVTGIGPSSSSAVVRYVLDDQEGVLTRQINSDDERVLIAGLGAGVFEYRTQVRKLGEDEPPTDEPANFGPSPATCTDIIFNIEPGTHFRQRIQPVLPADCKAWKIDTIRLRMKRHALLPSGTVHISFYRMLSATEMAGTPLASFSFAGTTLPSSVSSIATQTHPVNGMPWLAPDDVVALVIHTTGGTTIRIAATTAGTYPSLETYTTNPNSAATATGFRLCMNTTGNAAVGGSVAPQSTLMETVTLVIKHEHVGAVSWSARPVAPALMEP